jgi:hypothetical protein
MICLVKGTYFTNFLTPWSRFLIHKLIVAHLVKKFPNLYGTWRFITTFTVARYWTLFWARWIQSTSSHPLLYESLSNVGSSLHVFRLKFCTYFSSPPCIIRATPITTCMICPPPIIQSWFLGNIFLMFNLYAKNFFVKTVLSWLCRIIKHNFTCRAGFTHSLKCSLNVNGSSWKSNIRVR